MILRCFPSKPSFYPAQSTEFHLSASSLPYLLSKFIDSRRRGISSRTTEFYECCLRPFATIWKPTHDSINLFLSQLCCHDSKNAYYRAIRALYNRLYRQGYIKDNLISRIDAPKITKVILPGLASAQVD